MDLFVLKSLNLDLVSLLKGKRFTVPLSQAFKFPLNLDKKMTQEGGNMFCHFISELFMNYNG